jgi:hypothetical protein
MTMRARPAWVAFGLGLASLFAAVPVVEGQAAASTPDPARITLGQADLDGWTQSQAVRTETWGLAASNAPNAASQMYSYETQFTRPLPDGSQETLTTRAIEGPADLRTARLQAMQHDALGQTQIPVADGAVGFWENTGGTIRAGAAAQAGNLLVELQLNGVTPAGPVTDDQVSGWLSTLASRANSAPGAPPLDWSQVLAGQPLASTLVLDQPTVGDDWDQQTGLQMTSQELGGTPSAVSAAREFSRTGAYRRTLSSTATVYDSAADASTLGMTAPGKAIDMPALGDQATGFKALDSGDAGDAPEVTYTINVRRGPVVVTTQETGVAYSLDSPEEALGFATAADGHAAALLSH